MVRCVLCRFFTRKTCVCTGYGYEITINPKDIHKQKAYKGYGCKIIVVKT